MQEWTMIIKNPNTRIQTTHSITFTSK